MAPKKGRKESKTHSTIPSAICILNHLIHNTLPRLRYSCYSSIAHEKPKAGSLSSQPRSRIQGVGGELEITRGLFALHLLSSSTLC